MHRELIEGAAFLPPAFLEHLDAASGWNQGRIYRIVATDQPLRRAAPRLDQLSSRELVERLDHPNGWHRDAASRLLYSRNDRSITPQLRKLAQSATQPEGRAAALSALRGVGLLEESLIVAALSDESPELRAFALQLSEPLLSDSSRLQQAVAALADDDHLIVRYQLAFTVGAMGGNQAETRTTRTISSATQQRWLRTLAKLVQRDAKDPWLAMATLSSLPPEGGGALFSQLANNSDFRSTAHGQAYLQTLTQHLGKQPTEHAVVVTTLAALNNSADQRVSQLAKSLTEAFLDTQPTEQRAAMLAATTGATGDLMAEWIARAQRAIKTPEMPAADRRAAILTLRLAELRQSKAIVQPLLSEQQPVELQLIAIELLTSYDAPEVADQLLAAWDNLTPTAQRRAAEALLTRVVWLTRLLDATEAGQVKLQQLDASRMSLLRQHPDPMIASRAAKLFPNSSAQRQRVFAKYRPALEQDGSAAKGKLVFQKNCSACHRLDGVGTTVGADLRGIASRGLESVLLNVLDPNREVKPKFVTYAVQTDDGRVLSGMILNESANSITLRQADGVNVNLQRADISRMRDTGQSFMPEGLEKELSVQDVADLLSFLAEAG